MFKGWNLIFIISWFNEKCFSGDFGYEVGIYVVIGFGWSSGCLLGFWVLWFLIRDLFDIRDFSFIWYKR